jgi:uncharacterized protein YceH (UPF0502 family)
MKPLIVTGDDMEQQNQEMGKTVESWPPLDVFDRRILGVLIEKAKTTPEYYPLTLNALVTGSNQKSNRDPIMNLDEFQVENAIKSCIQKGIVSLVKGGRVDRWQHHLYEKWNLSKRDMSILGELLLRGPQTEGQLRSRVLRMESFDSLEDLRASLDSMAARKLVVWLDPKDRRGARVTHGFHIPVELQRLAQSGIPLEESSGGPANQEFEELKETVSRLQEEIKEIRGMIDSIRSRIS